MKKIVILFAFLPFLMVAQLEKSSDLRSEGLNTIPNAMYSKVDRNIDLSAKLAKLPAQIADNYLEPVFIKDGTWDDYILGEGVDQATRNYYTTARDYFQNLSPKIKTTFTVDELWYIYQFDAVLAVELSTIN
jgi:hypothetical protein